MLLQALRQRVCALPYLVLLHSYMMMSRSFEACIKLETLSCCAHAAVDSAMPVLEARHEGDL